MRARLLLLAAGLAAFGGSLFAGFHLDDYAILSSSFPHWWRNPHLLTDVTFRLNQLVGGQEPLGYHAVNLLLHLGAVLLAYECLRRLLPATAALVGAGIFAVHPLQAEAVNYVAQRGVLVAAILALAALLAWTVGVRWLSVPAFVLAMLTHLPWTGYGFVLPALRFLRLFAIPWGFTIDPHASEPLWLSIAGVVAVMVLLAGTLRKFDARSPWVWLVAGVALLIPSFGANPAADPRAYLAVFALGAAVGLLVERVPSRAFAVGAVAALAVIGMSRTYVWMSDERLWREAMRRAPEDVQPKIQLAKTLKAADAIELLARARSQSPYNPEIPSIIGKILLDEQQYSGALDELSRAVALDPRNTLAFNNRGVALAMLGQTMAARADFEHALQLDPNFTEARENLQRLR